jgi:hypothetical protein
MPDTIKFLGGERCERAAAHARITIYTRGHTEKMASCAIDQRESTRGEIPQKGGRPTGAAEIRNKKTEEMGIYGVCATGEKSRRDAVDGLWA